MIARSSYRLFGILAILNVVLVVVTILTAPAAPFASGADLVGFENANRDALLVGNYLGVIQPLLQLVLLMFVAAVVRQAEARSGGWLWPLILGSSLLFEANFLIVSIFFTTPPLIVEQGIVPLRLMVQLGLYGLDFQNAFQAMVLAVTALATLRLRFLPAWLGWVAWVIAFLSALGTLGLFQFGGLLSPAGPITLLVAGMSHHLWLLLAGIYWLTRPAAALPGGSGGV